MSQNDQNFDTLTRSVALTGPEKFLRKAMCICVFFSEILKSCRTPKCWLEP